MESCLKGFSFGGLRYHQLKELVYLDINAQVWRAANEDVVRFLWAHVEWARVLIALGGTVPHSWRLLDPELKCTWAPPKLAGVVRKLKLRFVEKK